MSHYSKIFNKVPVEIPNKSGFDLSHENCFTAPVGTLVPVMCHELLPGDSIKLGISSQIQLPPMATDFYGRVEGRFEAFFVPNRVVFGGWQDFITQLPTDPLGTTFTPRDSRVPGAYVKKSNMTPGSLADYLNCIVKSSLSGETVQIPNVMPFLAYHKIVDDWYIDTRIQKPSFIVPGNSETNVNNVRYAPYLRGGSGLVFAETATTFYNGKNLLSLRQRNFQRDYFTNCTPRPQMGAASSVGFKVDSTSHEGSFTIAQLRQANALQQFLERNNIAGFRYGDQIKAQFGVYPSDAVTDRSLYLGSSRVNVYNKSVYQNQSGSGSSAPTSQNPFSSVGAKYSSPIGVGDGSLCDNFTSSEHGYVFIMFSLCPSSYYDSAVHRMFLRKSIGDFAFPLLAGVGDQEVYSYELNPFEAENYLSAQTTYVPAVFGYNQRYAEYKYMNDEVHGLLRHGQSLSSFALKRAFQDTAIAPQISTSFIEIDRSELDEVAAVNGQVSSYGCWVDSWISFKKVSTLPAYSIPTLGDMKDTHTEVIDSGGKML